jgi:hypothetical protein
VAADDTTLLIRDMRASFERLQQMVAELHPTDEADPAKAEVIAGLKRELDSLRGGLEQFEGWDRDLEALVRALCALLVVTHDPPRVAGSKLPLQISAAYSPR